MANDLPSIRVIGFRQEYKTITGPDGKSETRPIEYVKYAPIGAMLTNNTEERVDFLRPPESIDNDDDGKKLAFMKYRWSMIEPAYDAWKAGQEIPVAGTPLAAWPILSDEQRAAIMRTGIKTVEDLAELPDSAITKLPLPNARDLGKQARLFLETTDRAVVAQQIAERDEKIAVMEEEMAAMKELLQQHLPKGKAKAEKEEAA